MLQEFRFRQRAPRAQASAQRGDLQEQTQGNWLGGELLPQNGGGGLSFPGKTFCSFL